MKSLKFTYRPGQIAHPMLIALGWTRETFEAHTFRLVKKKKQISGQINKTMKKL